MDYLERRTTIINRIDEIEDELIALGKTLHENPELGFQEFEAVRNITTLLKKHGFKVIMGKGRLKTAFKAEYHGRAKGPTVAFLAEYDALPEIGHGCGHNLIATMAVGAAIGLKEVAEHIDGRIVVLGTPAEEGGGGKVLMLEEGYFDDIDYALMMHPCVNNMICRGGLANRSINIEYFGKSVHSAYPEGGVNALQATIQTFNMIDHFRGLFPLKSNINGIIREGGKAPNIIPDYSSCEFSLRANTVKDLKVVEGYIDHIVETMEKLIGVKSNVEKSIIYAERYPNRHIDEKLKENIALFGVEMEYPDPDMKYGSSDIGNVSLKVPAIHSYIKIADKGTNSHSMDFTKAANSPRAYEMALKATKAMALTGYDILIDEDLRRGIQEEFDKTVPKYDKEDFK